VEPGFGKDTIAGLAGRIAGMAPVAVRFGWNGARLNGHGHLGLDGESLRLSGQLGGGPPIDLHATRAQVTGWQRISAQRIGLRLRADGGNGQLPLRVLEFERNTDAERLVAWLPGSASHSSLVRRWYEERLGPYRREALASYAIAGLLLACYVLQAINSGTLAFDAQRLFAQGANLPPQTLSGEPWRLLTAMFLHADFGHLLGNLVTLVALAPYVERLYGRPALLAVFLGAGLAGSAVDLFTNFSIVAVGASGAVFGVVGALLAYPLRRPGQLPLASMRAILALGGLYLAWSLKQGFDSVGINSAHVSGLVAGFVLGLLLAPPFERERRPPTVALAAAAALLIALAGCAVAIAVARGSDNFRLARLLSDLADRAGALDAGCQAATSRLLADPRDGRAAYHDACVAPLEAVDAELRRLAPADPTLDQQVAEQLARIARRRDANSTFLASLGDVADRRPAEAARANALAACDRALALLDGAAAAEVAPRLRESCIGGFDRALDLLAKAPARSPEALRRQHAARTLWRAERDAYARMERAVVAADAEAFGRAVDALDQARSAHAVVTRAPPGQPGADEG
jgi:membrane associated rhomboid family serine protease